jgi:uncharacterized protein (DUF2236 family)
VSLVEPLGALRSVLADAVRTRVSTVEDAAIFSDPGARWFADDAVVRTVHADASMFVGGLRALLLQALHPLAMAGVVGHSGYRGDPWGRLQRTSRFIAMTTFGPADQADALIRRIRRIHETVTGIAPDGRAYAASDPHLLSWVHLTEVDSFLTAHRRFGAVALAPAQQDQYVAEEALVASKIGVLDPPTSVAELRDQMRAFRGELAGTADARDTARYLLFTPPLPLIARPGYGLIAAAAIGTLPGWSRRMLRLPPPVPVADRVVGALIGQIATRTMRWAITAPRREIAVSAPG